MKAQVSRTVITLLSCSVAIYYIKLLFSIGDDGTIYMMVIFMMVLVMLVLFMMVLLVMMVQFVMLLVMIFYYLEMVHGCRNLGLYNMAVVLLFPPARVRVW